MGRRHKSESLGNFFLELFDLGLREFDDSSATFANDVIVVTLVLEFQIALARRQSVALPLSRTP